MSLNIPLVNREGVLRLAPWVVANPSKLTDAELDTIGRRLLEDQPVSFVERRPFNDDHLS
jgi:hypothetical protein